MAELALFDRLPIDGVILRCGGMLPPRVESDMIVRSRLAWQADVNRIDRERILRGLSQQKLAQVARVDPGTLSDLLGCRRRPNLGTLSALCQALGMNLGDVIQFEDSQMSGA